MELLNKEAFNYLCVWQILQTKSKDEALKELGEHCENKNVLSHLVEAYYENYESLHNFYDCYSDEYIDQKNKLDHYLSNSISVACSMTKGPLQIDDDLKKLLDSVDLLREKEPTRFEATLQLIRKKMLELGLSTKDVDNFLWAIAKHGVRVSDASSLGHEAIDNPVAGWCFNTLCKLSDIDTLKKEEKLNKHFNI